MTDIYQGSMFVPSPSGYQLLQSVETWVTLQTLTPPSHTQMNVVVDALFTLDEVTEAHHLSIAMESYPLRANRLPEVISIWSALLSSPTETLCFPSNSSTSSPPAVGELRGHGYSPFSTREPITVYELLIGTLSQTQSIALLEPKAEVLEYCLQKALLSLKEVWVKLRGGLRVEAPRASTYRRKESRLFTSVAPLAQKKERRREEGEERLQENGIEKISLAIQGASCLLSLKFSFQNTGGLLGTVGKLEWEE